MNLLSEIKIEDNHQNLRYIKLYKGDLSAIPENEKVDLLVVSSFPNNYQPLPNTLIGALDQKGMSVQSLSKNKAVDLREQFACWLSNDVTEYNLNFSRLLCFEPLVKGEPQDVVGSVFQSIMPFVFAEPSVKTVAMPILAAGNQRGDSKIMLNSILTASYQWLQNGVPLDEIKIVIYNQSNIEKLLPEFNSFKQSLEKTNTEETADKTELKSDFKYDIFISYSHKNTDDVMFFVEKLKEHNPNIRIYLDRFKLDTGSAWQQELYEALDECKKVVPFYSDDYLQSKICKEEFNIGLFRHRDTESGVLVPIYLYGAKLPTYMKLIQFIDCREADKILLENTAKQMIEYFND